MPPREPSLPPSEPRPARAGLGQLMGGAYERPARMQMIVALVLGLVLVAIPLYLWRRPRAEKSLASEIDAGQVALAAAQDAGPVPEAGAPSAITLSTASIVECHDPGPKKTPVEQCDHLVPFEQSFAKAIEDAASCVGTSAAGAGGVLPFVADVSFQRKKTPVIVFVAKDGRTLKSTKAAAACSLAVKKALTNFDLDPLQHAHSRYRIQIAATYPGGAK